MKVIKIIIVAASVGLLAFLSYRGYQVYEAIKYAQCEYDSLVVSANMDFRTKQCQQMADCIKVVNALHLKEVDELRRRGCIK